MKTFFRFIRVFMLAATIASILWCSVGTIVFLTIINSITWGITGYTEGIEAHTCGSGFHIYHNGSWCNAVPYIYHSGSWCQATSNLYHSGWNSAT